MTIKAYIAELTDDDGTHMGTIQFAANAVPRYVHMDVTNQAIEFSDNHESDDGDMVFIRVVAVNIPAEVGDAETVVEVGSVLYRRCVMPEPWS